MRQITNTSQVAAGGANAFNARSKGGLNNQLLNKTAPASGLQNLLYMNKKPTTPMAAELKPHLFGNTGLKTKFSNKNLTNTTENPKYGILNQSVSSLKGPLLSKKRNAAEAGLSKPIAGQFQTKKLKLEGGFRARAPGGGAGAPQMNFIERNKQKIREL